MEVVTIVAILAVNNNSRVICNTSVDPCITLYFQYYILTINKKKGNTNNKTYVLLIFLLY